METSKFEDLYIQFPRLYVKEDGCRIPFECEIGWFDLLRDLSNELIKILPPDGDISVLQVKEKFGTLRYYVGLATDEIWDLIDLYEEKSEHICELCGKHGSLDNSQYWLMTLCDDHKRERSTKSSGQ